MKQCCGNCKYGVFRMTNHAKPRPQSYSTGNCTFQVPQFPLVPMWVSITVKPAYIHPEDGKGIWKCEVWEPKS